MSVGRLVLLRPLSPQYRPTMLSLQKDARML